VPGLFCQGVTADMAATGIQTTITVVFRPSGAEPSPVRLFARDGRRWIVASDVCRILGIRTDAVLQLVPEAERSHATVLSKGSVQSVTTVTEAGFNLLVTRSTRPVAKRLREWMAGEVLHSIPAGGATASREQDPS